MRLHPRRVCIVRHSDVETDVRVMKEARALRDAGFEVDVVCLARADQPRHNMLEGLHVHRVRIRRRRGSRARAAAEYAMSFLWMALRLTALFFRRRHALIQVNTMPDFLIFAAGVPRMLGARLLLDLHEPVPELYMTKFAKGPRAPMVRLLAAAEQAAIRFSDRAVTVNETIRRRFIARGGDPRKIGVVRNVPDETVLKAQGMTARDPNAFTLITHGTIEKYYGHELMIRAVASLKNEMASLRLIIAGEGT